MGSGTGRDRWMESKLAQLTAEEKDAVWKAIWRNARDDAEAAEFGEMLGVAK